MTELGYWLIRNQSGLITITMVTVICLITALILLSAYEGSMVGLLRHHVQ